jgi:tetratricopeptide (TPR) repeat protein
MSAGPERDGNDRPESACLDAQMIDRLALGREPSGAVAGHLATCASCRAALHVAQEDAEFAQRARHLVGEELGPVGAPRLPGYRVQGIISAGSQGVVYRAIQESTHRSVAIKCFEPGESGTSGATRQRARAEREVEVLARLRHANVVGIYESRVLADGRLVVVMEYVDGAPLDQWTPPGLSAGEKRRAMLRAFVSICQGVHHAHLNGVIHRDLKPQNILIASGTAGAPVRPVVVDFGIARLTSVSTTMTGDFAGTPAYASPEQAAGSHDAIDALTDVYSLGVVLYRMLSGKMPYELTGSILDIARKIAEEPAIPLRKRDASLSRDIEAVVDRAMRKQKERRYQSAAALGRDIERYLDGQPVEARAESAVYVLRRTLMANRGRVALAALAIVATLVSGAVVYSSLSSASASRRLAAERQAQARLEAARARAVTEVLREAIPAPDPSVPQLKLLVSAGFGRLFYRLEFNAFADDPEVDQQVRRIWGGIYTSFGGEKAAALIEYSEVSLRNGLVRLRLTHGQEHPEIAESLHQLASVLLVRRRYAEAERVAREAMEMRLRLIGPGATFEESRLLLAKVLMASKRSQEADNLASEALTALAALPENESDRLIASMSALRARVLLDELGRDVPRGTTLQVSQQSDECERLLRTALTRRLRSLPIRDSETLASIAAAAEFASLRPESDLSELLGKIWGSELGGVADGVARDVAIVRGTDDGPHEQTAPTGRTAVFQKLLSLQESLLGPDDPAIVNTLLTIMRAAEREFMLTPRWTASLRAADVLASEYGANDLSVLTALTQAVPVMLFDGEAQRAAEVAARACRIHASIPDGSRDGLLAGNSERVLAWALAVSGKHLEASERYQAAIDQLTRCVGERHHTTALAQAQLAVTLTEMGQVREGEALARRALRTVDELGVSAGDQLGHVRFAVAHAMLKKLPPEGPERRAALDEARELLTPSAEVYARVCGLRYPWYRIMLDDLIMVATLSGREADVVRWRGVRGVRGEE